MKWIALAPLIPLLTACGCCTNRDVIEYRQVSFKPAVIATPVHYDPVTIIDDDPLDVTTTTIDYY
jgi:hypothetical protein